MPRQPKVNKVTTKNKVHEVPLINEMIQKACEATTSMPAKFTETHDVLLDDLGDYLEEPFTIIQSYFEGKQLERLSRHQIESYNNFVNYQMQKNDWNVQPDCD